MDEQNEGVQRAPRSWLVPAALVLILAFVALMWLGWVWLINLPGG